MYADDVSTFVSSCSDIEVVLKAIDQYEKVTGATGDIILQVTLTRQTFGEIPNVLLCCDRRMLVVVEGRKPYCWNCGVSGYMAKVCSGKASKPPSHSTTTTATKTKTTTANATKTVTSAAGTAKVTPTASEKASDGEWMVVKDKTLPPPIKRQAPDQQRPPQERPKEEQKKQSPGRFRAAPGNRLSNHRKSNRGPEGKTTPKTAAATT